MVGVRSCELSSLPHLPHLCSTFSLANSQQPSYSLLNCSHPSDPHVASAATVIF